MPLDKDHMTLASRVMLPAYVVVFGWLGINYLFTPLHRLDESPALRYLNNIGSIRGVGILLIGAGAFILVALVTRHRLLARYALIVAGLCFFGLLVVFTAAPFFSDASPSAGAWPLLGFAACCASYRSVTHKEV